MDGDSSREIRQRLAAGNYDDRITRAETGSTLHARRPPMLSVSPLDTEAAHCKRCHELGYIEALGVLTTSLGGFMNRKTASRSG